MGLIEKLQVLKMLDDMKNGLNQNRCENEVVFLEILKKKIEGLEGVKSESGWIPCSKKMPEPYDEEKVNPVLATYESVFDGTPMTSEQAVVYLGEGEWVWYIDDFENPYEMPMVRCKITAWQPLPEPYYPTTPEKCNPHLMSSFTRLE